MSEPLTHLELFASHLHREVGALCAPDASTRTREDTFTENVLSILAEHNESDGAEVCFHEFKSAGAGSPAARLNAWCLSGDGNTIDLFIVLYHGTGRIEEVGKPEARRHFKLLRGFLRRALDGLHSQVGVRSDASHVMQRIHKARDTLALARLFFITDGVVRSLDLEEEEFAGLDVDYVVWDLEKLSRLHVGERKVIELDFVNEYDGAVPCLRTVDATGEYQTLLAFFPAALLARIYGQHGQRLLERNVRAFLQAKGKVNRGLQRTLREEPHRFLAYNNGLCCTAADVRVRADREGHTHLEWVSDFQIVNGGQTTASIFHALRKEKTCVDQVVVQLKLTVLRDASKVSEIVPLISRFANSQNKVNAADFEANGPYHHRLESVSRNIWAPATSGMSRQTRWYYERARGSYADDLGKINVSSKRREWQEQNPPHQKFTKTDLAKFEHAWLGLPHFVCLGAEKNFVKLAERMEDEGEPVVDESYFKNLAAKAILWRTGEKLFDTLGLMGYRANSVAYAVAWLAHQSRHRVNLPVIWRDQRLSPELCDAINAVCELAHKHILAQPGNPGEASKRESCWAAFRDSRIALPAEWEAGLSDKPFVSVISEDQALEEQWDKLRAVLVNDPRSIGEIEALTGRSWTASKRGEPVQKYAGKDWSQLRAMPGMGLKKIRGLVELFSEINAP